MNSKKLTAAQQPAPPSAPVGVIGDAIRHLSKWLDLNDCECESGHQCGRTEVEQTRDQLRALTQQPAQAAPGDGLGWEENVSYLLDRCPHAVRVREGGGPESLVQSLIVTFMKLEKLATPPGDDAAGGGHG